MLDCRNPLSRRRNWVLRWKTMGMEPRNHSKRHRNSSQRNSDDRWQLQRRRFADNLAANNLLSNETTRQGLLWQGNPDGVTLYCAGNGFRSEERRVGKEW